MNSPTEIEAAAEATGVLQCIGGQIGWSYDFTPAVCTADRCSTAYSAGDMQGVCAYGASVVRTCGALSVDFSRLCPCAHVLSPSAPPPPYVGHPPPPMPNPPLASGSWILAEEGTSCTQECRISGGVCDASRLDEINTENAILQAAAAAGTSCSGGVARWSYADNPSRRRASNHGRPATGTGTGPVSVPSSAAAARG